MDTDLEAQAHVPETQPVINADRLPATNTSTGPQLQAAHHNERTPAAHAVDRLDVQRGENHGDSSDGLWTIYLTEAEKQDTEVTESWKGDTEGILVFTGLFSSTVASFLIESYKTLSPDPSATTNALLTQISGQLVNISNGSPLASIVAPSKQPFKPTASAVRVNVLWFISLILSLTCALSATLMQQWARRYQELVLRRRAPHRRGPMRAYIFDGITRFEMAHAIATMPKLLHISVFLFFTGLVDFLIPINATVAYDTLGCIVVFVLAYAILTILPIIYLNCPYGTPLSETTWRISQFSVFVYLWTNLEIRKFLSNIWSLDHQQTHQSHGLQQRREALEKKVKERWQWFSQGLRKSVDLGAYRTKSTVVASALEWTLTSLDEDKEIEDFAARVPGFFDSRAVADATTTVLSLMSHEPNTEPIFGSRLYDLLKTCIPETSALDEKMRKNRLRVCLKCLWYFGRAYNRLEASPRLPSYFPEVLSSPEVIRRIQTEDDSAIRMIGYCFGAMIVNKLTTDLESSKRSSTDPISARELACLSAVLGKDSGSISLLLSQPGAIAVANMTLLFNKIGTFLADTAPSDVLDVVRQTLATLSEPLPSQGNIKLQQDQPIVILASSEGNFERVLLFNLLGLLYTCLPVTPSHNSDTLTCCLQMCLKGLWSFGRAINQLETSIPLPFSICTVLSDSDMTRRMREHPDAAVRVIGKCVEALVANKLAVDINSGNTGTALTCLSTTLDSKSDDVKLLLRYPAAIELTNMVFLASCNITPLSSTTVSLDMLDIIRQTLITVSLALPPELNEEMQRGETEDTIGVSHGPSYLTRKNGWGISHVYLKNLWEFLRKFNECGSSSPLPSYVRAAFTNPEMAHPKIRDTDVAAHMMVHCIGALVVNKLAADIKSRNDTVTNEELACLSTILGIQCRDVELCISQPGAIELANMISLMLGDVGTLVADTVPSGVLDLIQQTLRVLSQSVRPQENIELVQLDDQMTIIDGSDGRFERVLLSNILNLLDTHMSVSSPLTEEARTCYLQICLKGLWCFGRAFNQRDNSVPLPSSVYVTSSSPEVDHHRDLAVRVVGHCVRALVVNRLAADSVAQTNTISDGQLAYLSTILSMESRDVELSLGHPGAVAVANMISFTFDKLGPLGVNTVPLDVLDILQQTLTTLSQPLSSESIATLELDRPITVINGSDGLFENALLSRLLDLLYTCTGTLATSPLTEKACRHCLRMCLKGLWYFGCAFHQLGNSITFLSSFCLAFFDPELTRRLREHPDPAVHMMGHCFRTLIVSKLSADINSRNDPISDTELRCLSAILGSGPESRDVTLCISQPSTVAIANMMSLIFVNVCTSTGNTVPSDVLDMVQQTLDILSQSIPSRENAGLQLDQPIAVFDDSDGKYEYILLSGLLHLHEMYVRGPLRFERNAQESCRRICMKGLWYFGRALNDPGNAVPLPSPFISNPKMIFHMPWIQDPAPRVVAHCVGALVVNKLVADIYSRDLPVNNLEPLSTTLGINGSGAKLLLCHPAAIKFTNIISLATRSITFSSSDTVSLEVLDIIRQTFVIISRDLPPDFIAKMRLDQIGDVMGVSPSTSYLTRLTYWSTLHVYLKNMWEFTREYNERGNSLPLPSYVRVAFTIPEMANPQIRDADIAAHVILHCVRALIVNKLLADINSRNNPNDPATNGELVCLAAILNTNHDDVRLCLSHPGTIKLAVMASLAFSYVNSEGAVEVPLDARDVLQQTLNLLSQTLPAQETDELQLDLTQTAALRGVSDEKFERTIVLCHYKLLETCRPGASSLPGDVRTSCLRMCLKSIWHFSKACDRVRHGLPAYFPVLLANPETIHHLRTEQDPATRIIGCCLQALIANRLLRDLLAQSNTGSSYPFEDAQVACISSVLDVEPREGLFKYDWLHAINFRKVVSLVLSLGTNLNEMEADVLTIVRYTIHNLTLGLGNNTYIHKISRKRGSVKPVEKIESDPFIKAMNQGDPLNVNTMLTFLRQLERILSSVDSEPLEESSLDSVSLDSGPSLSISEEDAESLAF